MPIPVKITVVLMNSLHSISSIEGNCNLCKASENLSFIPQVLCCILRKQQEINLMSQRKSKIMTDIRVNVIHSLSNDRYCITNSEAVTACIASLSYLVLSTTFHGRERSLHSYKCSELF